MRIEILFSLSVSFNASWRRKNVIAHSSCSEKTNYYLTRYFFTKRFKKMNSKILKSPPSCFRRFFFESQNKILFLLSYLVKIANHLLVYSHYQVLSSFYSYLKILPRLKTKLFYSAPKPLSDFFIKHQSLFLGFKKKI